MTLPQLEEQLNLPPHAPEHQGFPQRQALNRHIRHEDGPGCQRQPGGTDLAAFVAGCRAQASTAGIGNVPAGPARPTDAPQDAGAHPARQRVRRCPWAGSLTTSGGPGALRWRRTPLSASGAVTARTPSAAPGQQTPPDSSSPGPPAAKPWRAADRGDSSHDPRRVPPGAGHQDVRYASPRGPGV